MSQWWYIGFEVLMIGFIFSCLYYSVMSLIAFIVVGIIITPSKSALSAPSPARELDKSSTLSQG